MELLVDLNSIIGDISACGEVCVSLFRALIKLDDISLYEMSQPMMI